MIVDQAKEDHRVREDRGSVNVDLVATLHERSEVHLKGSSNVIKSNPLMKNKLGELIARDAAETYSS